MFRRLLNLFSRKHPVIEMKLVPVRSLQVSFVKVRSNCAALPLSRLAYNETNSTRLRRFMISKELVSQVLYYESGRKYNSTVWIVVVYKSFLFNSMEEAYFRMPLLEFEFFFHMNRRANETETVFVVRDWQIYMIDVRVKPKTELEKLPWQTMGF